MGYDRTKIAEHLKIILAHTTWGKISPPQGKPCHYLGGAGTSVSMTPSDGSPGVFGAVPDEVGPSVMVIDEGIPAIEDLIEECLSDEELSSTVGREAIANQVDLLLRARAKGDTAEITPDYVRFHFLKPLKEGVRPWRVILPVVNLTIDEPLNIGEFAFISADDARKVALDFLSGHEFAGSTQQEKDFQRQQTVVLTQSTVSQARTFITFEANVHAAMLDAHVQSKATHGINLIRFFSRAFHQREDSAVFGLPTEVQSYRWGVIGMDQSPLHGIQLYSLVGGGWLPFHVSKANLAHLREKCHLDALAAIAQKPARNRTSLESVIIQAIQVLGKAVVATSNDDALLGATIALERLFIRDREMSTTERFAERLAIFLGADLKGRKSVLRDAKRLYDLRSRIVHAAYSGVTAQDTATMEYWAFFVLLKMLGLHAQHQSHDAFCQAIEDSKLGT